MVKRISKAKWRVHRAKPSAFVKNAYIRNGKRYIHENGKIIEVEVIGMRKPTK